jgi:hypothetical protein
VGSNSEKKFLEKIWVFICMKVILTENQFSKLWFRRRMNVVRSIVDKYCVIVRDSRDLGLDDYFDEVISRVILELTNRQELTLGQKINLKDFIRISFGNRIEYYHKYGEFF